MSQLEKDKMLLGELFSASDPALVELKNKTYQLLNESTQPHRRCLDSKVFNKIFPNHPKHLSIQTPFHCDFGDHIIIGDHVSIQTNCKVFDSARVTIGDYTKIGPNVTILTASYPVAPDLREKGLEFAVPVTIGENVWIGGSTTIYPGVTIGDNCVVQPGSVVTQSLPENSVCAGSPCKATRKIDTKVPL